MGDVPWWQPQKLRYQRCKFPSGRYQWAGARQKESTNVGSLAFIPGVHFSGHLDVCQTRTLPLGLTFQDKKIDVVHKRLGYVLFCLSSTLGVVNGRELSLCYSPLRQRHARPLATRARQPWDVSWAAATKKQTNWGTRSVRALFQEILALWRAAEGVQRWCLPPEVSGKDYSGPLALCLIRFLPPPTQYFKVSK